MKSSARRWALLIWLLFTTLCIAVVSQVQIGADLSAFLPRHPTPEQLLLTEQLRDGIVSRLILVGIEGGNAESRAQTSKQLATRLQQQTEFSSVNNGEEASFTQDQNFLIDHRYLLSAAVTPQRFSTHALHESLDNALQLMTSPAGILVKRMVPRDPSGELLFLLDDFAGRQQPEKYDGVWASRDGKRAVLLLQTVAAGYDIDQQQQAITKIHALFAQLATGDKASSLRLLLSGPGVFSVNARDNIKNAALNFSLITTALVALLLLAVYRSPRVLALSLLPVISGALAGIAAVSLNYGVVYGITLGFGITLIGEAIDYSIYFFTRLNKDAAPDTALNSIWPTLRLGVSTSVCGFSAMFFAGFPGLAQLGLFSVVGLIVAVLVTRWVLPALVPDGYATTTLTNIAPHFSAWIQRAPALRPWLFLAVIIALISIGMHRGSIWSGSLSSLSPLAEADQRLDETLRNDLGAPDVRYLAIVTGKDSEQALQHSEAASTTLNALQRDGALTAYDAPSRYLPSQKTQQARLSALPQAEPLRAALQQAQAGLPFRSGVFEPFLDDVAKARAQPLLKRADLTGTHFALQTDSLLVARQNDWMAMLPLRGVKDADKIMQTLMREHGKQIVLLDLKQESDNLYQTYVSEAVNISIIGVIAIIVLLFISLRSPRRVFAVLLPLFAAVAVTMALVLAFSHKLLIFHLVGLLLVIAVGSNYSLFFDRENIAADDDASHQRTMIALLLANISTVIGFGMLAFSGVPVLTAIGVTVGIGAILSLVFSAILMGRKANR